MIFVALGANLPSRFGAPHETLEAAKREMEKKRHIKIISSSRIWLSAPVPVSDDPWYYNAVIGLETALSPASLLEMLQSIENDFGRIRTIRNAPRLLDLDLIGCNDEIIESPNLTVPHPRMHERAFVLLPMREIVTDWVHPVLNKSLEDLIADMPQGQNAQPMEKQNHG